MAQYAIYSRKSRFTGKGESIENQVGLCRQYLALHYGRSAGEEAKVYEDEGFSGGTLDRPQFQKMMGEAARTGFDAIVVYRLDRISRNVGDFVGLIEELSRREIAFISIREQFDTSSVMGRAMMYITSVFSQLERETIAERIRDNMHELARTGRWLGGVAPTGYASESADYVGADGKVRRACRLKTIPEEMALVKEIFDRFDATCSLTGTEADCLRLGLTSKNGRELTRYTIKGILTNPVYMIADGDAYRYFAGRHARVSGTEADFNGEYGVMCYNRTLQKAGRAHRLNPVEQWIVAVGRHEGVIPGRRWIGVQERLARNGAKGYGAVRGHTALLSGVLKCGACGSYMRPKLSGRSERGGERHYAYLCTMKERSRGACCAMKNADGNRLDAAILERLREREGVQAENLSVEEKRSAVRAFIGSVVWDGERADFCAPDGGDREPLWEDSK